jgi:hypothetical protein
MKLVEATATLRIMGSLQRIFADSDRAMGESPIKRLTSLDVDKSRQILGKYAGALQAVETLNSDRASRSAERSSRRTG